MIPLTAPQPNLTMKKTLLIATLAAGSLWAGNATVRAQGTTNPPAASVRRHPRSDLDQLGLTADQKAKAEPIVQAMMKQLRDLRTAPALTTADKRTKLKETRAAATAQLKAILTSEQFAKWQKLNGPHVRPGAAPEEKSQPEASKN